MNADQASARLRELALLDTSAWARLRDGRIRGSAADLPTRKRSASGCDPAAAIAATRRVIASGVDTRSSNGSGEGLLDLAPTLD